MLGYALCCAGRTEEAIPILKKAVALNPTLSRAQLNLGVALAKQGNSAAAIGPLEAAAKLDPQSAQASFYLGSVYAAESRYAEAEKYFLHTLQLDAGLPTRSCRNTCAVAASPFTASCAPRAGTNVL